MLFKSRRFICMGLFVAGSFLTGCASLQTKPEEAVAQRATERWQALVKGQLIKAYEYNTPGYKALVTPESFIGRTGIAGRWLGAEVIRVECAQPKSCKAVIRLDFQALFSGRSTDKLSTHIDETWLLEDGQWWIFQKV
jgi:hypothetical protein